MTRNELEEEALSVRKVLALTEYVPRNLIYDQIHGWLLLYRCIDTVKHEVDKQARGCPHVQMTSFTVCKGYINAVVVEVKFGDAGPKPASTSQLLGSP
jgi:hypothetical protein